MHILPGMRRVDGSGVSELRRRTGAATAAGEDGCAFALIGVWRFKEGRFVIARQTLSAAARPSEDNEAIEPIALNCVGD
jgi:hypothetical protein